MSALELGCRDVATVWSADATSPDNVWAATAQTDQYGGPGTAGIITSVFLKRANAQEHRIAALLDPEPWRPIQILVLSDESGPVSLTWIDSSHLEVIYHKTATLEFQVVRCAGIEISARAD